jgi:hypothetical protein
VQGLGAGGYTGTGQRVRLPGDLASTETWGLMRALKKALIDYARQNSSRALRRIKSWPIGFVFPESVLPALTIFPLSKTFLARLSDGTQWVSYRLSIDVYSAKHTDLNTAKSFCLDIVDDVKQVAKYDLQLYAADNTLQSFATRIDSEDIYETVDGRSKGFNSSASLEVSITSYHQMADHTYCPKIVDAGYNEFFDRLLTLVEQDAQYIGAKDWIVKTAKTKILYPAITILPQNEHVVEERSNGYAVLARPMIFQVVSRGYPKAALIRENLAIADRLVSVLEANYMVDGMAQEFALNSIEYAPYEGGMLFASTINVEYRSRVKLETNYR